MANDYDYDQLYPGRFLKAGELGAKDWTLEISEVLLEELEGEKGKKDRGILMFKGAKKGFVLNRTNGECLLAMWGRKTRDWIGKRVTLYATMVPFGGAQKLAIRVRGSPDLPVDLEFELKLPRKKAKVLRLLKTGAKPRQPGAQQQPAPQRQDEPPADLVLPGQTGYVSPAEPPPPGDEDAPGGVQ